MLAVAAALVAPFVGIYPVFLMKVLCFALFACAFNLLLGYGGLLSFGHAAVPRHGGLRRGARGQGLGPDAGARASSPARAAAALLGLVVGALAIRRQGIYFAMITLALAQMIYFFCLQAPFTGGEDGIQAVPRGKLFGLHRPRQRPARCTTSCWRSSSPASCSSTASIHSPFGQVLKAIRENEPRAISLGYDADRYKLIAFVLSAALAGPRRRDQGASCSSSPR